MSGQPTAAELSACLAWFDHHCDLAMPLPFSLQVGDQTLADLLPDCDGAVLATHDDVATVRTIVWTDPSTGLRATLTARCYDDFPAVEWVVTLTNTGSAPTPILSDIRALDCLFPDLGPNTVLHWAQGSDCDIEDFAPRQATFYNHPHRTIQSSLGRPSYHALPFFNLHSGDHGVIGAIGWTGSWQADFVREEGLRVRAGMQRTHLSLQPGESLRTPRILLVLWQGERLHGHNLLRQLILRHYSPTVGGETPAVPLCNAVWGENRAQRQIAKARWWREHDLPLEAFWIDAGWYGDAPFREDSTVFNSQWGSQTGNWWPNRETYPEGLGPVGEALRELDLGFVLWVEPERVVADTRLTREHPEWLLGPIGRNYLFNLGLPEARQAMTDLLSDLIAQGHVTWYRQDFNMDPAPFWEAADAPDRIGMSEIRHIEGLYAMWDELRARHPGLQIDNCSSGGRRLDLEMARRSVPLWRSDYQCFPGFDPVGLQGQTHGLALWLPLSAGVCDRSDTYAFRSGLSAGMVLTANIYETDATDFAAPEWLRKHMAEQVRLRPYFRGDFFPLLPYSPDNESWAAWQFDRPDLGEGCVIAFRRPQSPLAALTVQLQGLDEAATYVLEDLDGGAVGERTGADLAAGLAVAISEKPGTKLLVYRRQGT
jgi:alpha-galactosidase